MYQSGHNSEVYYVLSCCTSYKHDSHKPFKIPQPTNYTTCIHSYLVLQDTVEDL